MKNFYYSTVVLIAMLLQLCGCSSGGDHVSKIEYIPFKENSNDLWGLISAKGEILYENEFKSEPSPVVDGLFVVEENGKYSLYKAEKKPKLLRDGLASVGRIFDDQDYIVASEEESHVMLLNKKGETVKTIEKIDGKEISSIDGRIYENKYLLVRLKTKEKERNRYVLIDLDGNAITYFYDAEGSPYSMIPEYKNGKLLVGDKDGAPKVIDLKGETVLDIDNKKIAMYNKDGYKVGLGDYSLVSAFKGDRPGFLDMKGGSISVLHELKELWIGIKMFISIAAAAVSV